MPGWTRQVTKRGWASFSIGWIWRKTFEKKSRIHLRSRVETKCLFKLAKMRNLSSQFRRFTFNFRCKYTRKRRFKPIWTLISDSKWFLSSYPPLLANNFFSSRDCRKRFYIENTFPHLEVGKNSCRAPRHAVLESCFLAKLVKSVTGNFLRDFVYSVKALTAQKY